MRDRQGLEPGADTVVWERVWLGAETSGVVWAGRVARQGGWEGVLRRLGWSLDDAWRR